MGDPDRMEAAHAFGPDVPDERETPRHVACIMDGNGRWASRQGLERTRGHAAGEAAITATVDAALEARVEWLTLFAFSTENWRRPAPEVTFLMEFNRRMITKYGDDYHRRGIRIRYLGRQNEQVPASVRRDMREIQERTAMNSALTLTFAFNYGGRAELVDAVRALLERAVRSQDVDERTIAAHFQFPDTPDPDLIIRTSGEYRLSNFMLWGAAYAELVFLDVLWPDFRAHHFDGALELYRARRRRFGAILNAGFDGAEPAGFAAAGSAEARDSGA